MTKKGAFRTEELTRINGSPKIPELSDKVPLPYQKAIDEGLAVLQAHKDSWVAMGIPERVAILDEITRDMERVAERWVAASLDAKSIPANTLAEAEEWALLATIFRALRLFRQSLIDIRKHGRPRISGRVTTRPDGQAVAQVFPQSLFDRILFRGVTGEVLMEPGVTIEETISTQARLYQDKSHQGKVALVLGAGNASVLPVIDFLHKLFLEDQVVVLKPNPVNVYLGPLIEEGCRALTSRGFLRVIYGGVEEGSYLCYHPAVDEIHLTGSDKTFEAITFGPGPEGDRRKAERKPLISKRFTGELGNVSPVIIVPGPWDEDDIKEQATQLATRLVVNAGFACLTPRVIIQHRTWAHRDTLVEAIGHVLAKVETRKAYYPGAKERHAAFIAAHPEARQFGHANGGHLPWTFITDVDAGNPDDICFKREAFCSLCAETALEASSVPEFIDRAVEFANKTLWGTLNATLMIHPKSFRDPIVAASVDHAIAELRYGTVLVNLFAYYSYHFMVTPWGGFPGQDIYDIQSGIGKVANVLMFGRPQKSVARGPFNKPVDPLTVTSKRAWEFGKKLAHFEASPSAWKLPSLLWTALRS